MTNYDGGDDDGNDDGSDDGNDDDNAASGSGSDGPIFDPITTSRYRGVGSGNDGNSTAAVVHYISTCCTIYLPYKYPIKDVP